jgi:hypothetical protein
MKNENGELALPKRKHPKKMQRRKSERKQTEGTE